MGFNKKTKPAIISFFRRHPDQRFGAVKIDQALGFDPGGDSKGQHLGWETHKILWDLVEDGHLVKCPGKKKGFKYKKAS